MFSHKIISFIAKLFLVLILLINTRSNLAQAGIPASGGFSVPSTGYESALTMVGDDGAETDSIFVVIEKYINFFLGFVAVLLLIAILYGGFQYLTSWTDEDQHKKGLAAIRYAIFGLIIVVISYALAELLLTGLPKGDVNAEACKDNSVKCEDDKCNHVKDVCGGN